MLVFVDESGDTGLKLDKGSSRYFVISLVLFEEHDEAIACSKCIELLKKELGIPVYSEFKFSKLKMEQRKTFLKKMLPYSFFYFGIIIDKKSNRLYQDTLRIKESFYKYTCSLVFENAKPYLKDAIVVVDGSGSRQFKLQFQSYLKHKIGAGIIKKIKIQDSKKDNLIQLADMIAGALHRSLTNKGDKNIYRKCLSVKEFSVQVWPR